MNESLPPAGPDHDPLRLRHVLTIVLAGAALGAGFNALQLAAGSSRGLAWVKSERRVVSLGSLTSETAPAPAGAPAAGAPGPTASRPRSAPPSAAVVRGDTTGPGAGPPHASHERVPPGPGAPAIVPPPAAAAAPVAPPVHGAAAGRAAALDLPAIPDSRDPIEVGLDVAQQLHAAGAALFLDARSAAEYAEGHIAGAISLPFEDVFRNPALVKGLAPNDRVLITYCDGGDCDLSRSLAFSLLDAGFRKVLVFKAGLPAWVSAGQGVRTGAQP